MIIIIVIIIIIIIIIIINYLLSRMEVKTVMKVMKYQMQIKVECFGVACGMKVKNIIEMQSGKKTEGRK